MPLSSDPLASWGTLAVFSGEKEWEVLIKRTKNVKHALSLIHKEQMAKREVTGLSDPLRFTNEHTTGINENLMRRAKKLIS